MIAGRVDRRILFGIFFMCGTGLLFPVMGGLAKILGSDYSSLQVSWARAFGHIVFMLIFFVPKFGLRMLRTRRLGTQMARSALLFASNATHFYAITFIPIAKAASISLMAPLVVVPFAWAILGERTTVGRMMALLVLASATTYALYQVLTRMISAIDSPETSAIYSSIVGSFGMLLVLPFVWTTPHNPRDVFYFCCLGVLGGIGHYFVARALTYAPANIVSPFQYMQLIGSVVVGYLFFGDFPDVLGWVGAAIIVGAGLYIGLAQSRRV